MRAIGVVALAATLQVAASVGGCPNACSKHGRCSGRQCICYNGYRGYDCSERRCAAGLAWASVPSATNTAHTMAECSNAGVCDRKSGACKCGSAFSGIACERMACPNACSDHGRCMSLSEAAASYDGHNLVQTTTYTAPWDAEKIYGCVCDWGWAGHSCALRVCPMGDDPMTAGQVNEVQTLTCTGNTGHFWLTYKTFITDAIAWNAAATTVKAAIDALPSIGSVTVVFADVNEVQTITIGATGGTFDLAFGGQTTAAPLTAPASAAAVQTALEGLSSLGPNVDEVQTITVVATGGTFQISFVGANGVGYRSSSITAPASAGAVQTALEALNNIGASVDEVQTITVVGTSGTWDVTFDGQSTTGGALTAPATAAQVQAALEGLSNIAAGSIGTVTQATPTAGTIVYTVTFTGTDMAGNQEQIAATDVSLAGGTPSVASATTVEGTIGSVGTVTVNTATAGTSIYTITFTGTDVDGDVNPLVVPSDALLTGGADEVQQVTVVATGGSFQLLHGGTRKTAAIAMPATADAVQTALEALDHIGASVDEVQTIAIYATGGSFDLEFNGQTTAAPITAPATAATVQTALEGLSNIAAGSVGTVTLDTSTAETSIYTVTFTGADVAGNVPQITVPTDAALTGGIDEVQTLQIHALGGTFNIEFSGQTTGSPLTHPASAAAVQTALESLSNINGGSVGTVTVDTSVPDTSVYTVTFTGADVYGNVAALTVPSDAGLTDSDEIQLITVTATSGTFDLNFGGHTTTTLTVGASADTVQSALEALSTIGASVDEVQTITIGATGGTFQIAFNGQTSGAITAPASADAVQTALEALSNIGASVDEVQTITVVGTSGTWDVTFDGQSTTGGALTAPATAAQVKAALEGLSNVAVAGLTVTEATPTAGTRVYTVTFSDPTLAGNRAQITATNVDLAGGTPSVASATTTVGTIGSVGTVTVDTATADTSIYTFTFGGADVVGNVAQVTVVSDAALTGGTGTSAVATTVAGWVPDASEATTTNGRLPDGSTSTTTVGVLSSLGTVVLDTTVADTSKYTVTFIGDDVNGDVAQITVVSDAALTGGSQSSAVATTVPGTVARTSIVETVKGTVARFSVSTTTGGAASGCTVTVDTSVADTSTYSVTFTGDDVGSIVDGDVAQITVVSDAALTGGAGASTVGTLTTGTVARTSVATTTVGVPAHTVVATTTAGRLSAIGTVTVDTSVADTSTYTVTFTGSGVEGNVGLLSVPSDAALTGGTQSSAIATITVGSGSTVCTDAPGVSTSITFDNNGGDLPILIVGQPLTGTLVLGVTETVKGTKESAQCSNHGICDTLTGRCVCEAGFAESDGMGGPGMIRDCGYNDVNVLNVTKCHGWDGSKGICSGAGLCEDWSSGYVCTCHGTHQGFRCQERKCPVGRAWWDEPTGTNTAHARETECRCVLRCMQRPQTRMAAADAAPTLASLRSPTVRSYSHALALIFVSPVPPALARLQQPRLVRLHEGEVRVRRGFHRPGVQPAGVRQ